MGSTFLSVFESVVKNYPNHRFITYFPFFGAVKAECTSLPSGVHK